MSISNVLFRIEGAAGSTSIITQVIICFNEFH